jgi:hypothetical protein
MFDGFDEFDIPTSGTTIHGCRGGEGPPLLLLPLVTWHVDDVERIVDELNARGSPSSRTTE